jgi:hypothetical protein|tara:strand:- start:228 stop:596 length:369 start_codon:yes stop_codon:yes gene_type:complete
MAILSSAKYFSKAKDLSATSGGASGDVIYTCPNNFISLVKFLHVSSGASSAKKYSLQWYEAATTTYHFIIDEHSVAANGIEEVIEGGAFLALAEGDKIIGFEESSSDFHVIVSGEEYYQPTA